MNMGTLTSSGILSFDPGRDDIYLTRGGTDAVVFGPRTVDLVGGGNNTVIATGTSNLSSVDAVLRDDFVH